MTVEEVGRAYVGFKIVWFQSSHMTEKKKKERVMERKKNRERSREGRLRPKQTSV